MLETITAAGLSLLGGAGVAAAVTIIGVNSMTAVDTDKADAGATGSSSQGTSVYGN